MKHEINTSARGIVPNWDSIVWTHQAQLSLEEMLERSVVESVEAVPLETMRW